MERITIDLMPEVKEENQKHLIRYVNFINSRPERDLYIKGFHAHHIYPRSMAIKNNIENYDEKWNLIELTPREHFIAHLILWKCNYPKMIQAFWYMNKIDKYEQRLTSRQFEKLEIQKRVLMSLENRGKITVNNGEYNLHVKPDEIPEGFARGFITSVDLNGTVWINNGIDQKQVDPDEIPDGWQFGMLDERAWINDGKENRYAKVNDELPVGFTKGRLSIGYWIHNDTEEKYTNEDTIPEGYEVGRLLSTTKNTVWYTNGVENRMLKRTDTIPDGFYMGINRYVEKFKHITNGMENKYLYENENIPNGWWFGSTINMKKRSWITNGADSKRWNLSEPIPKGWRQGKTVAGFWITNGITSKLVQSEGEITQGWKRGRFKSKKNK